MPNVLFFRLENQLSRKGLEERMKRIGDVELLLLKRKTAATALHCRAMAYITKR